MPRDMRFVELPGICNCRDLGGLPTAGGSVTRRGVLYRSEALCHLDDGAVDQLHRLGITTIMDLRSAAELERFGRGRFDHTPFVWLHIPLSNTGAADYRPPAELARGDLGAHYARSLTTRAPALARAIEHLSDPDYLPALFHCTAGKDRTGTVAALILSLVDVDPDAIVDDYTLTDTRMPLIIERFGLDPNSRAATQVLANGVARAQAESMHAFLDALDADYGGAHGWARWAGIPDETVDRLRRLLIDDSEHQSA